MKKVSLYLVSHKDFSIENNKDLRDAADTSLLSAAFPGNSYTMTKNKYGKPYFTDEGAPFFSISHAKGYSVLAESDAELGVDIEEIKEGLSEKREKINADIAKNYFDKDSAVLYEKADPSEKPELFAKFWTAAESMLKCAGTGFYADPRNNPSVYEGYITKTIMHEDHVISVSMKEEFEIIYPLHST